MESYRGLELSECCNNTIVYFTPPVLVLEVGAISFQIIKEFPPHADKKKE